MRCRCESRINQGKSMTTSNAMHPRQTGGVQLARVLRTLNLRLGASHWEFA